MNRTNKPILLTLLLFAGLLNSCNANENKTEEKKMPETSQPVTAAAATPDDPNWKNEPGIYAQITTPKGVIVCELEYKKAPMTVANFVALSEGTMKNNIRKMGEPFYDGLTFHRVEKGFVIQGGDPAGNGSGGPNYKFPNEVTPDLKHDKAGTLAMANAGPNTNSCQFYITLAPTPQLDGHYNVYGYVVSGMDVVNNIAVGDKMNTVKIIRVGADAQAFDAPKVFEARMAEANKIQAEKDKMSQMSIEDFVKKNYPKAKKTASGLYYVVEKEGTGARAVAGKSVSVHYTGTFADGSKFDSSRDRGQPITFTLGQHQVIEGWDEGIAMMSVGAQYKLIIPYQLAYGEQGRPPVIPAKSMLVFDTELMDVK